MPSKTSEKIMELVQQLEADEIKFESGNQSAGTRVRKTLQQIKKVCQEGRKEVQNAKNSEAA